MLNQGLGFVFTAKDMASGVIKGLEGNFNSLAKKTGIDSDRISGAFQTLGAGIAIAGAGMAALGGGFALADMAGKFEASIAMVGAVADASAEQMKQLENAAIQAGIATQFSPTEATAGLRELAQAGFNVNDSIKLLAPVLDMAAGSMGELTPGAAAGLAAQTLKAFGIEVEQASVSVDKLLKGAGMFALSAGELPAAIGITSRGAQALNQSLDETVIAFGLVKNIVPGVERASTAVAVSMERMANPKVQKALNEIGVSATDAQHRFRPFLDIMGDLVPALDKMTEQERAAFVTETFGAHALGGINAIMKQIKDGVTTSTGAIMKGRDAIAYLRGEIGNAGGTAEKMRKIFLGTFEGQKKLLAGSMETLGIVMGKAFTPITGPIVEAVTSAVNAMISLFQGMPEGVRNGIAKLVMVVGGLLVAFGSILMAKGAIMLLAISLKVLGVTLGGIVAVAAPVLAVFAALAVAVYGFHLAYQDNLGGIRDFTESVLSKVTLAWDAMMQLFQDGGFSGAVLKDLDKAENQGVQGFVVNLFLWVNRIKALGEGIWDGFKAGVKALEPELAGFVSALRNLGQTIGLFASQSDSADGALSKWQSFSDVGHTIGTTLSAAFGYIVAGARVVIAIFTGMAQMAGPIQAAFGSLGGAFTNLFNQIGKLFGMDPSKSGDGWTTLGNVIGGVITGIVWALGLAVNFIAGSISQIRGIIGSLAAMWYGLSEMFTGVVEIIAGVLEGRWAGVWQGMKRIVFGVVSSILQSVLSMVSGIGGMIDSLASSLGIKLSIGDTLSKWKKDVADFMKVMPEDRVQIPGLGETSKVFPAGPGPQSVMTTNPMMSTTQPMMSSMAVQASQAPPVSSSSAPSPDATNMPALAALMSSMPKQNASPVVVQPAPSPPVTITTNLMVNEEVLATAVNRVNRSEAGRTFSPVAAV